MKHLIVILLIFQNVLINEPVFANSSRSLCDNNYCVLSKGDKCPYDGLLVSDAQVSKVNKELENCDKLKLINKSLNKSIELYKLNEIEYKAEISELKIQNVNLDQALEKANTNSTTRNVLYFGLGIVTTGLLFYAARH